MPDEKSNLAKGRDSFDAKIDNSLVAFFNKNVTPYPTEVGAPAFDLIPIEKQKYVMDKVARMHGQQEYNRIMQLVAVLQTQAASIKRRLEITDWVHAAKYQFQTYHGNIYWFAHDTRNGGTILVHHGPEEWYTGAPEKSDYMCRVKGLGDYTWLEVDGEGNPIND
jgi:hypothetical protein